MFAHLQLDSTAFFPYLSFGANNEVAGIATLMAVADALGQLKKRVFEPVTVHSFYLPHMHACSFSIALFFIFTEQSYKHWQASHICAVSWCKLLVSIPLKESMIWLYCHFWNTFNCLILLQESWDYIGSSRMVYDMVNGVFPYIKDGSKQVWSTAVYLYCKLHAFCIIYLYTIEQQLAFQCTIVQCIYVPVGLFLFKQFCCFLYH